METLLWYLLKSSVVSGVFYLLYHLILRRESFFTLNRFYLLICIVFSYLFPFIRIDLTSSVSEPTTILRTIHTTVNQFTFIEEPIANDEVVITASQTSEYWWLLPLVLVSLAFLFRFLNNIIHLWKTIIANEKINHKKFTLVLFNQHYTFSFFRYIFISQTVWNSSNGNSIIDHELSHLQHKHSLDRMFMEVLLIIFWMNPFIYLYRKALEEVHEFQADADATQNSPKKDYFNLVLQQASHNHYSPLMSPFSYKLIKKRIKMANKKSNPFIRLTLILPILIGLIILTTSAVSFQILRASDFESSLDIKSIDEEVVDTTFIVPVSDFKSISGWGYRVHPIYKVKKLHQGMDFLAQTNTPVYASQSGTVTLIKTEKNGYGKHIEIQHANNYKSLYAHLNSFNVSNGQKVKQGDVVGYVGNTGSSTAPHLHFEIQKSGKRINPASLLGIQALEEGNDEKNVIFNSPIRKHELKRRASGFGMRIHPIHKVKKMHNGVDYVAPFNTDILAIAEGVVRKVNVNFEKGKGYGRFIIIDHANGYSSLYAQLNGYNVEEGQEVKLGDVIGYLGSSGMSTGPHLHLELKKNNKHVNPEEFIK